MTRSPAATLNHLARERILLLVIYLLLSGCGSQERLPRPSIEFTRIPAAAQGGPDKLDIIQGLVIGARPGEHIVLYARNGTWWVQPLVNEELTKIQPDSKWINSTHLGTEYAALLVEPGYHAPAMLPELPVLGGGVMAMAIAQGE